MKYYTNVITAGNKILARGVDKYGEAITERIPFKPHLFVKSPTDNNTYKTIDGEPVARLDFSSINDAKEHFQTYKDVEGHELFGYPKWNYQWMSEEFSGDIDFNMQHIRIFNMDIEVASNEGFPDPKLANQEITAIGLKDSKNGKYYIWAIGDFDKSKVDIPVMYIQCDDETELIESFLDWWAENPPDILTGWNVKFFDVPYIINRCINLEIKYSHISPWKKVYEQNKTIMGKEQQTYSFLGISILDYMDLYKKSPAIPTRESYKLDFIGYVELDLKKTTSDEMIAGYNLYKTDHQKFINYLLRDIEIVDKLDAKLNLIALQCMVAYDAKVNYEDVYSPVRTWENLIYNYLKEQDIVTPLSKQNSKSEQFAGAYVKDPQLGMHNWVMSFDFASLYPNIIRTCNIGPDTITENTILQGYSDEEKVKRILNRKEKIPKDLSYTVNGSSFSRGKMGMMADMIAKIYNGRVATKKELFTLKKSGKKDKISENKKVMLHLKQHSAKIFMNSLFGAMGNQYFNFFDIRLAEAITLTGQASIQWVANDINEYMNKLLQTKNVDYNIYSDTDSCYISFDALVTKVYGDNTDRVAITNFLQKVTDEKINPLIQKSSNAFCKYLNAFDNHLDMEMEVIADRAVFTGKKRYMMNVLHKEGITFDNPELKIMGIESVRSTTPESCRDTIKECVRLILTEDNATVIQFIADFKKKFYKLPIEDISRNMGVQDISEYASKNNIYRKGAPMHVKGVLLFNHNVKKHKLERKYPLIQNGSKIKFATLKKYNPLHDTVIAFETSLPKEFGLEKYIDYNCQWEKCFLAPVKSILDIIGWNAREETDLCAFM